MLNIPDSVKALFKRDGVYKNFRAHFPNGELSDLTNENILQESVKFTESVCSQDVFKFGLTEASVIEFETVGAGNMYGMTIECSCEIDCSSLSAADKADIAAGTWDGTWDGENEVFSVPYGTFRVESCPRDHQAMTHRRVTAYTEDLTVPNPFEVEKCALMMFYPKYEPNVQALIYEQIFRFSPSQLLSLGWTVDDVSISIWPSSGSRTYPFYRHTLSLKDASGNDMTVYFDVYGRANHSYHNSDITKYRLFSVNYNGQEYDDAADIQAIADKLGEVGVDAAQSGFDSLLSIAKSLSLPSYRPMVAYGLASNIGAAQENDVWAYCYPNDNELFYPWRLFADRKVLGVEKSNEVLLVSPTSVYLNVSNSSGVIPYNVFTKTPAEFERYSPPSENDLFPLSFEATNTERVQMSSGKVTASSFINAFSISDIAQGYLELTAQFSTAARSGGNRIIRIDNTSPAVIIPGEYSQMWFDEYNVDPIGTIRYSYTDEAGEEQIVDYQFGDGTSIYDMTDNKVLKLMGGSDPSVIEALLDTYFIPNIAAVNFVPVDLTMKGLPYIEAGDALSVTAQDGTVCSSYALRHEINGIQSLEAQIDSESGLIIDSEEAAT